MMPNTALQPPLEWPLAPYAVLDSAQPEPECEAYLKEGKILRGMLLAFHENAGIIEILLENNSSIPTSVSFSNLKHFQLTRPITLKSGATIVNESEGIYSAPELREIQLEFSDDDRLSGKTFGMLETSQGIYLYLEHAENQYLRSFIPATSIRQFSLGEPLGKMLTDRNSVSHEDLAAGLKQQQLRTEVVAAS